MLPFLLREDRQGMYSRPRFWIKLGLLYGMAHGPFNVAVGRRDGDRAWIALGVVQIASSFVFLLLLRRSTLRQKKVRYRTVTSPPATAPWIG